MNFKSTLLALTLFATSCQASELIIKPYNKETDEQNLRSFFTNWCKRAQNITGEIYNEEELNQTVDSNIDRMEAHHPDPNVTLGNYLVSQGNCIRGLISAEENGATIIYFDSTPDATGNSPVAAKIVQEMKQDPRITKIVWVDFNNADTEKKQKDIAALVSCGFTQGETGTIPFSNFTFDTYELFLDK